MTVHFLEREMFAESEAARHLQLSQATLHYWLEGGGRRGKKYLPVVRESATGSKSVTWGEFVEAALLRQYRKTHGVPMSELRNVIVELRQNLQTPYPLATALPFVGPGRKLLLASQETANLPGEFWLVTVAGHQPLLTPASQSFYERVEWADDDSAAAWRPTADPKSPVRMRPDERFGLPSIGGVRTEHVWEHLEEDESFDEVAEIFDLSIQEVRWAHAYETSVRAA